MHFPIFNPQTTEHINRHEAVFRSMCPDVGHVSLGLAQEYVGQGRSRLRQHSTRRQRQCEFTVINSGTEPHHFEVQSSCGCTVPVRKAPIAPGNKSAITVKYDTKRIGPINKSVTITSNASNEPTKVIRIKGKVEPSDLGNSGGVPVKQPAAGAPTTGKQ